jgi:Ni/Co efflux regulator RcnB
MNKRNLFSFLLLTCVATISVAGIFHESDEDHTAVTGRRKMHLLHGGKSKSERREEREERKGRNKNGKAKSNRKPAKASHYRKSANSDE